MMNVNLSTSSDSRTTWLTVCEFCVKETAFAPIDDAAQQPCCPSCGATLQDRVLIMALISAFSESGDLRVSKFIAEKQALGLKFGSIGNVFSHTKHMAALVDYPFREDRRDLSWRTPSREKSLRIPLTDHLLDALIAGPGQASDTVLKEALRVLRPGGLLIMPADGRPSQPSEQEVLRLRAAGFFTHFLLPCAAHGQLRRGALLLAIAPRTGS